MNESIRLHHVALHCDDKKMALRFYQDILGLELVKTFSLTKELTEKIFGLEKVVEVLAFQDSGIILRYS